MFSKFTNSKKTSTLSKHDSFDSLENDIGLLHAELDILQRANDEKDHELFHTNADLTACKKTIDSQSATIFELQQQLANEKHNKTLETLILLMLSLIVIGVCDLLWMANTTCIN